jgi:hypothetical protein
MSFRPKRYTGRRQLVPPYAFADLLNVEKVLVALSLPQFN